MATITSTATGGLASAGATWVGGVAPVQASAGVAGDKVVIATTAGNAVVLDGVYWWGDDTSTAITINANATLQASRSVNSGLTCCGHFVFVNQTSFLDAGTAANPITSAVTFALKLNHSVVLASNKWGATVAPGKFSLHGSYRNRNAVLLGAVSAGAVSCSVDDATGWAVGDTIVLAPTTAYNTQDLRTITSITPGAGTTASVGFSALTNAHAVGAPVGNFSSNVTLGPYDVTKLPKIDMYGTTASAAGDLHAENVVFLERDSQTFGMWGFNANNSTNSLKVIDPLNNCAFLQTDTNFLGGCQICVGAASQDMVMNGIALYSMGPDCAAMVTNTRTLGSARAVMSNFVIYRVQSGFALGTGNTVGTFTSIDGSVIKLFGCNGFPILASTRSHLTMDQLTMGPTNATSFISNSNFGSLGTALFTNSDFGTTFGLGSAASLYNPANAFNANVSMTLRNCTFNPSLTVAQNLANGSSVIAVANKNNDPTQQAIYDIAGTRSLNSDSYSTDTPSTGSYQFSPNGGSLAVTDSIDVFAQGGQIGGVNGYYKLSSPAPTSIVLTISGAGLAVPVTQTLTLTPTGTWLPFLITCVPVVASSGLTLLSCKIEVIGPAGSYVRFDELQQVFAQFNPGGIAFFRDARPVLGARTLAPDVRYQPVLGLSFPANSVGESLQKLANLDGAVSTVAPAVLASTVEGSMTLTQAMRLMLAALTNSATGLESPTPVFKSLDGTKDRITATYAGGTRTVTARDVT